MIAVFTEDFKDEEDGKDHPNRIPTPDMQSNEDEIEGKKEKKKGSRRKHKHRSKGKRKSRLDSNNVELPDYLREPSAPDLERNKSVIPDNWELTRTPSGSDSSEYERSEYEKSSAVEFSKSGRRKKNVKNKTAAISAFDAKKALEQESGLNLDRNGDLNLMTIYQCQNKTNTSNAKDNRDINQKDDSKPIQAGKKYEKVLEANDDPKCLHQFHSDLPRNLSVIPNHMLMNKAKKVKSKESGSKSSDETGTKRNNRSHDLKVTTIAIGGGNEMSRTRSKSRSRNPAHEKDQNHKGGKQKLSKKLSMSTAAANMGVTIENFIKMKSVTGLTTEEIIQSHKGFLKKFPRGIITYEQFKDLALTIGVEKVDLDAFVKNIFKMFDLNNDKVLTFEEFTFATSAQNYDDPREKLYWLFDNVYDKNCSGKINRREMKEILTTLLVMEGFPEDKAYWLIEEVFQQVIKEQDHGLPKDKKEQLVSTGKMSREDFVDVVLRSELLTNLLTQRSDKTRKDVLNDTVPEVNPEELEESTKNKDKSKKKGEKEKESKKDGLSKPKVERQGRRGSATNLQIDNVAHIQARSKSKTRKVKQNRAKSPSERKEMEWDGKKWRVKGEKDKKKNELYDGGSDRSEMSFMDSKHQDLLMDKLLG